MDFLDWLDTLPAQLRPVGIALHDIVSEHEGIICRMRYKVPFFDCPSWFMYMQMPKVTHCELPGIELCFMDARQMLDMQHLLDFKKRTTGAGITFHSLDDLEGVPFSALIASAKEAMRRRNWRKSTKVGGSS